MQTQSYEDAVADRIRTKKMNIIPFDVLIFFCSMLLVCFFVVFCFVLFFGGGGGWGG